VLSHFRELNHFLVVTVNSVILSVALSHFAKVFSHLSLLNHFPPLKILSAIFGVDDGVLRLVTGFFLKCLSGCGFSPFAMLSAILLFCEPF
jgi:hypothetical protein